MDARACFAFVLSLVLWICFLVEKGLAIRCFMCNSKLHGSDCSDIMSLDEKRRELYNQECDNLEGNVSYTKCRKMVQEFNKGKDVRVIRQCAFHGKEGCTRRRGTMDVAFEYCQCKDPLCNSSGKNPPLISVAILSGFISYFIPTVKNCLLSF